jgi:N-acetylmuramoyl-L-alanine amidase
VSVAAVGLVASLAAAPPLLDRRVDRSVDARAGADLAAYVSGPAGTASAGLPLAGLRIALDPGHQLGNRNFPEEISRLVPAGGFRKPCNTTGTRTNAGYPEATLNFRVARLVRARLVELGAQVRLTRTRNSESLWGPCVDVRGRFGARVDAHLTVSLHADGARSGAHGFHVIAPRARSPWTTDIARPSRRLARALRAGLDAQGIPRSTYVGDGTALSIRADLGTLNLSDVPVAMLEMGNMRNSADARRMTSRKGRAAYARAVVRGIRLYLDR